MRGREGNKTQFLPPKSYQSKRTELTQLKQLCARESLVLKDLQEKFSHVEVPENAGFLPQEKKKFFFLNLMDTLCYSCQVTFPFYLRLPGSSEPNM